jgi:hypothetical protein
MLILCHNPLYMKKHIISLVACLAVVLFSIPACQKDNDPAPKTNTDRITTGTWKFSTAVSGSTDVSGFIQACIKDNIYTFVAAGTGTMDESTTKCNMADPQTVSFTWNFASGETVLHVSTVLFPGGSNDFTLVSISDTQLVVSQTITVGTPQTVIVTFIH